jgi:transcriptional regulator with XRE-family HTH domain
MALGARIKQRMTTQNLQQSDVIAKVEGLTQQNLSNLITRDSLTSEYAIRIADALGVSVRWLLDGQGRHDEPEWPFPGIERARWVALSNDHKLEIQGVVRERIDSLEADGGKRRTA